ncbi:MAG: YgjP-like metallopeptidase domain-containing protein [Candidatus Moraniibacteriota bacterium]
MLEGSPVTVRVRRSRQSRHLRLTVSAGGRITLSGPRSASDRSLKRFLTERHAWLVRCYREMKRVPASEPVLSGKALEEAKERARVLVETRLAYFNRLYNFRWGPGHYPCQKTLWGSCSPAGNLSFNYRLIDLPPSLADYVIVHELCHLEALDHSRRFWKLVERALPDYALRRRKLTAFEHPQSNANMNM